MADLKTFEKQILEGLFQMSGGYVLNFTDRTMGEFFRDDLGVNIYSEKYDYQSGSKANRMRAFWLKADDKKVGQSILKLLEYLRVQIKFGKLEEEEFSDELLFEAEKIAEKLLGKGIAKDEASQATFSNGVIKIELQKTLFEHIRKLLRDGHAYNAVEESYKIVRERLRDITGEEKATNAFKSDNYKKYLDMSPKIAQRKIFSRV